MKPTKKDQERFVRDFFRVEKGPKVCAKCEALTDWTQDGLCRGCVRERHIVEGILNPDGSER